MPPRLDSNPLATPWPLPDLRAGPLSYLVLLVCSQLATAAPASAQSGPVLHEYFEYTFVTPQSDDPSLPALPQPGRVADAPADAALPATSGGLVLTPGGPVATDGFYDERMGGLRNGPSTNEGDVALDRDTEREGMLRYQTAYDPSVVPWKRGSARDRVSDQGGSIVISVSDPTPRPVSAGGSAPYGFDTFRGSLTVLAEPGRPIPIPSVAADMRVHAVTAVPPALVRVSRDGADNYFVEIDASGQFDLELQVSAPRFYFGGQIPETGAQPGPPHVSDETLQRAVPVLEAVGVRRGMTERATADALTSYFRSFSAQPFPVNDRSEDLYQDIALSRLGVCRHRAQAFVITAAAAGMAARYVHNEAHAFVEVHFTGLGWRRIDLGGASEGLETLGDEVVAHAAGEDPFDSRPIESPYPITDGSLGRSEPSGPGGEHGDDSGAGSDSGDGGASDHGTDAPDGADDTVAPDSAPEPAIEAPSVSPTNAARVGTTIDLADVAARAYRGDMLSVRGALRTVDALGLEGREVAVMLRSQAGAAVPLGVIVTDADGHFAGELPLPSTLPPGRWTLGLEYPGDTDTQPAELR